MNRDKKNGRWRVAVQLDEQLAADLETELSSRRDKDSEDCNLKMSDLVRSLLKTALLEVGA